MFDLVKGEATIGTQWGRGGVGNAEWIGVSLRDVLREAGIKEGAQSVLLVGMDVDAPEEGYRRALPVDKAMHPDTLLAYGMNGEMLPQDHGFPTASHSAGLGRDGVHQMAGSDNSVFRADLDPQ